MQANIKLGRIFGIEVGLHYSWLIIALLVTLSLTGQFRATNPQWGAGVTWATAIATALLFFASIVAHELSHAAVAKANGLPVKAITLFALGGVAQIEREAEDAKTEFWMGIVGPIASAVIGFACLALMMARRHQHRSRHLQYDSGLPSGWWARAARDRVVGHGRPSAGDAHSHARWFGCRLRIDYCRYPSLLRRCRVRRLVARLHWLVSARRGARQSCPLGDERKLARRARPRRNDAQLPSDRLARQPSDLCGRASAAYRSSLLRRRGGRPHQWNHHAA